MEIEITSRKENKILEREEVAFMLKFDGKTPSRKQVQQKLADTIGRNVIVIEYIKPVYGASQATGYARGYTSAKQAKTLERQYILERNNLVEDAAKQPPEEKEAPPAEGHAEEASEDEAEKVEEETEAEEA